MRTTDTSTRRKLVAAGLLAATTLALGSAPAAGAVSRPDFRPAPNPSASATGISAWVHGTRRPLAAVSVSSTPGAPRERELLLLVKPGTTGQVLLYTRAGGLIKAPEKPVRNNSRQDRWYHYRFGYDISQFRLWIHSAPGVTAGLSFGQSPPRWQ